MEGVKWAKHYGGPVKKNSDEMESGGEKRERGESIDPKLEQRENSEATRCHFRIGKMRC